VAVGRKIEDESEAERCLSAVRRSGLSAGEWGRAHGVDGRSLHAWQMNLERRSEAPRPKRRKPKPARPAHALVELVPATRSLATSRGARYVLEVAGARIEFGDDVSAATLRRVLEAVRSC
jgi:hypothetical protein